MSKISNAYQDSRLLRIRLRTLYAARCSVIHRGSEVSDVPSGLAVCRSDEAVCPSFPPPGGLARVDDRRVVSGIVYVIRNGLQWKDAPPGYGPHKTLYNRFIRWSRLGVFDRIFAALVEEAGVPAYDQR